MAEVKWQKTCKEAKQAWNAVTGLKSPAGETSLPAGSASPLPQELWCLVFRQLAATLEPNGLRGPGVVAADIVRAGMTCRDMYDASREGLQALAVAVPLDPYGAIPRPLGRSTDIDWPFWDRFLREPLQAVRASRLKRALKPLAARASRLKRARKPVALPLPPTKPGLALRLLRALGLKQRCTAPARLWLAVRHERARRFHINSHEWEEEEGYCSEAVREALQDLLAANDKRVERVERQGSWAAVRKYLAASFGSTEELLAAQRGAHVLMPRLKRLRDNEGKRKEKKKKRMKMMNMTEEEKAREAERLRALVTAEAQNGLSAERLAKNPVPCVCGNRTATKACALKLCDICCRDHNTGDCLKHKPPRPPPADSTTATATEGHTSGPSPPQAGAPGTSLGQSAAGPGGPGTSLGQSAAGPGGAQSGPARATPAGQLHGGLGQASGAALGGLPASGQGRFMVPGNPPTSGSRYGAYGGQPAGGQPYGEYGLSSAAGGYSSAGAPHTAPGHGTPGLPYGPMYRVHAASGYGGCGHGTAPQYGGYGHGTGPQYGGYGHGTGPRYGGYGHGTAPQYGGYGHGTGPQYGGYGHGTGPQYGGPAPARMGYGGYGLPGYGGFRPLWGPGYGGQGHM